MLNILVSPSDNASWRAWIDGDPGASACGQNAEEAVGNLLYRLAALSAYGVTIRFDES